MNSMIPNDYAPQFRSYKLRIHPQGQPMELVLRDGRIEFRPKVHCKRSLGDRLFRRDGCSTNGGAV